MNRTSEDFAMEEAKYKRAFKRYTNSEKRDNIYKVLEIIHKNYEKLKVPYKKNKNIQIIQKWAEEMMKNMPQEQFDTLERQVLQVHAPLMHQNNIIKKGLINYLARAIEVDSFRVSMGNIMTEAMFCGAEWSEITPFTYFRYSEKMHQILKKVGTKEIKMRILEAMTLFNDGTGSKEENKRLFALIDPKTKDELNEMKAHSFGRIALSYPFFKLFDNKILQKTKLENGITECIRHKELKGEYSEMTFVQYFTNLYKWQKENKAEYDEMYLCRDPHKILKLLDSFLEKRINKKDKK